MPTPEAPGFLHAKESGLDSVAVPVNFNLW
jgi:hypothetical protein